MASDTASLRPVSAPARAQRWLADLVGRPRFWVALLGLIFVLPLVRTMRTRLPPPLPVLGLVPDFQLTDERGAPFGSAELRGRVWVADFIFTRCPTVCPLLTGKMRELQHRTRNLGGAFHLVSFSVDPDYDTPARLFEYARAQRASPRAWSFLTGSYDAVQKTVVDGIKVSMGRGTSEDEVRNIFHGSHLVLIDAGLHIRGYYDSADDARLGDLVRDIGLLVNRGG